LEAEPGNDLDGVNEGSLISHVLSEIACIVNKGVQLTGLPFGLF
jgi:hypothetical protein